VKASKEIFINNIIKKYPWVQRIVLYGGENVEIFGDLPFD
jgi:hypothetical protein